MPNSCVEISCVVVVDIVGGGGAGGGGGVAFLHIHTNPLHADCKNAFHLEITAHTVFPTQSPIINNNNICVL